MVNQRQASHAASPHAYTACHLEHRRRLRQGTSSAAIRHMEWERQMAFVNHFYFYLRDQSGAAFVKINAFARCDRSGST